MIVRILGEGQWRLDDAQVERLNESDKRVEAALGTDDQAALATALGELHANVRGSGTPVPDDELAESDLILPPGDATLAQVKELFAESSDGLIPG